MSFRKEIKLDIHKNKLLYFKNFLLKNKIIQIFEDRIGLLILYILITKILSVIKILLKDLFQEKKLELDIIIMIVMI